MSSEADIIVPTALRNELGTFVVAFLQGCNGKLTPQQVMVLAKNIEALCNERGFPVVIQAQ